MAIEELVLQLQAEIRAAGTPERAEREQAYRKSDLEHFGVTVPAIRRIVKPVSKPLPDSDSWPLAQALWQEQVREMRMSAAFVLSDHISATSTPQLPGLEQLLRESRTWALVDSLVPHPVGRLTQRDPRCRVVLDR